MKTLLASAQILKLEKIVQQSDAITLVMSSRQSTVACPSCQRITGKVHSRYERTIADLPWVQAETVRADPSPVTAARPAPRHSSGTHDPRRRTAHRGYAERGSSQTRARSGKRGRPLGYSTTLDFFNLPLPLDVELSPIDLILLFDSLLVI
jgi:transposase